ncbi:hypothetical protein L6R52_25840 [Myxococcota bacterium]|nr:hypothetical protein [Myxococcota bacterium]
MVILGCGAAKRDLGPDEQVEIIDLYTGPLYRARLAYARALGGPHWIVSGLHGLCCTDRLVGSYEHDLRRDSKRERNAWADRVASDIELHVDRSTPIVALCSGPYLSWRASLHEFAAGWSRPRYQVTAPAEGLPLGEQRRWLARETRRLEAEAEREQCAQSTPGSIARIACTDDDLPSFEHDAAEVLRDLPSWADDEPVEMRVGVLRLLLAGAGAGRAAA